MMIGLDEFLSTTAVTAVVDAMDMAHVDMRHAADTGVSPQHIDALAAGIVLSVLGFLPGCVETLLGVEEGDVPPEYVQAAYNEYRHVIGEWVTVEANLARCLQEARYARLVDARKAAGAQDERTVIGDAQEAAHAGVR